MNAECEKQEKARPLNIDWLDIEVALGIGLLYALLKGIEIVANPPWSYGGSIGTIISILCIAYILLRAERQPEKLREWGLTAPITAGAMAVALGMLALSVLFLGAFGLYLRGGLPFHVSYFFRMIDYVPGAFPQQFLVFAIGLGTLEKIPAIGGAWRLPLLTGTLFALGHFWSPAHFPGTVIPLQVIGTFPWASW